MRVTKSYRMTDHSAKCLKELAEKYGCTETNVIESLIISRYQMESQLGGCLSFEEILDILK